MIRINFRLGPASSRRDAREAETEHDDRNAGKLQCVHVLFTLGRDSARPDYELARTLLLMGDAEIAAESAQEKSQRRGSIFCKCPIVTLTLNRRTAYPADKVNVDGLILNSC